MEIQKLILIDFTAALNGGIKKGSIDAILLSIEMIEKGFSSNSISSQETHTKLLPLRFTEQNVCVCSLKSQPEENHATSQPDPKRPKFSFLHFLGSNYCPPPWEDIIQGQCCDILSPNCL